MNDNEIKQIRKIIYPQIKKAEERLESASFLLEREANLDAIPILFKAMDLTVRILLNFKKKPLADFQANIRLLEAEYRDEGLYDKETGELLTSLSEMNENYKSEIELKYEESVLNSVFEKAEDFLARTEKFLKDQLTTPGEKIIQRRARKILIFTGISIAALVVIFFLVKLGLDKFGPERGLLARYYNNINLEGPPVLERIDKQIDFRWGGSPHPKISGEFSVRWEGRIKIDLSDNYTFYIYSDEGVRLFVDDTPVIDTWSAQTRTMENSGKAKLKRDFHQIKIEYYFNQNFADIELRWSSGRFKEREVGKKVLYPPSSLDIPK